MAISAKASQAAAEYLNLLSVEFAPEVTEAFRDQVIALAEDSADRTAALFALIEDHDVSQARTMKAYLAALRGPAPQHVPSGTPDGAVDPTP